MKRGYYPGRIRQAIFIKANKNNRRPTNNPTFRAENGWAE